MKPSHVALLLMWAVWSGARASASPSLRTVFGDSGPCTAGEKYRFADGSIDDVWANNVFDPAELDRASAGLKASIARCSADVGTQIRGKVSVRLRVAPDGTHVGASITGIASRTIRECTVGAISGIRLPHEPAQVATDPVVVACVFGFGPHVALYVTAATSDVDRVLIRRALHERRDQFRSCYASTIAPVASAAASIVAELQIEADGSVSSTRVTAIGKPVLEACVAHAIKTLALPTLRSPRTASVTVAFKFD